MEIIHMADIHIDQRKTVNGRIIEDPATSLNIRMKDLADCMGQVAAFADRNRNRWGRRFSDCFSFDLKQSVKYKKGRLCKYAFLVLFRH
ncbi:MAG TPA: hypothetical protein ENN18_09045 [Proteobacteria bacterium]|nr:hypothetical protein [Pseudomonadota bacterium]